MDELMDISYVRLSKEDGDVEDGSIDESCSIQSQRTCIKQMRLRYDRRKGDFDYFTYCGKEVGKEIGDDALFTVGLQNYHFKNIESFFNISYDTLCKLQKPRSVATSCQDILMEYFREHEMLDAAVDGRMTILPSTAQTG